MSNNLAHLVSFSGGKDSTAMLLMMLEKGMRIDEVIFVDTHKEFPETYNNIEKVRKYIAPLDITVIDFDYDYYFAERQSKSGQHTDKKGWGWCDISFRWCTGVKQRLFVRYLSKKYGRQNVIVYIGIAVDEARRRRRFIEYKMAYPLVEWNITEKEALEYCYSKGFDFDGFYKKFSHASCFICPLQRISELQIIYNEYPELWAEIKRMDKLTYRSFKKDITIDQLEERFKNLKTKKPVKMFEE